jgi:hypothetical protein
MSISGRSGYVGRTGASGFSGKIGVSGTSGYWNKDSSVRESLSETPWPVPGDRDIAYPVEELLKQYNTDEYHFYADYDIPNNIRILGVRRVGSQFCTVVVNMTVTGFLKASKELVAFAVEGLKKDLQRAS